MGRGVGIIEVGAGGVGAYIICGYVRVSRQLTSSQAKMTNNGSHLGRPRTH